MDSILSNREALVWVLVILILVALPLFMNWWYKQCLLKYLKHHRPDSYKKLTETEEYDYETKRALWAAKDWSYYLESAQDSDDAYIGTLKKKILYIRKYFKRSIIAMVVLGAAGFLIVVLVQVILLFMAIN